MHYNRNKTLKSIYKLNVTTKLKLVIITIRKKIISDRKKTLTTLSSWCEYPRKQFRKDRKDKTKKK